LKDVYAHAMDRLKATPYEELLKPRFPDQPGSRSLLEMGILNNTRDHFAEHRATIEKAFRK
jgi:hypothetical protein